jgi:hypothetical protein
VDVRVVFGTMITLKSEGIYKELSMGAWVSVGGTLIVIALLLWASVRLIHKLGDKHGPIDRDRFIGLGGWLTFLIGTLMVWGPVVALARHISEIYKAQLLYPSLNSSSEWTDFVFAWTVLFLVLLLWQARTGWVLCTQRQPSSVRYAKQFFLFSPVFAFIPGLLGAFLLDLDFNWAESLGSFLGIGLINGIWFLYLARSVRVKNTYGLTPSDLIAGVSEIKDKKAMSSSFTGNALTDQLAPHDFEGRYFEALPKKGAPKRSTEKRSNLIGRSVDEDLYARCLAESEFDDLRAAARYRRIKAGLTVSGD